MLALTGDRRLNLAMVGGLLIPFVLGLSEASREYIGLAVVVPVLLGFGLIEIYRSYGDAYGSSGKAGVLLTATGISLMGLVVLAWAVLPPVFGLLFILAVPLVAGSVALLLGSGLLAVGLRNAGLISRPAAVTLGLGFFSFLGLVFFPSLRSEVPSVAWAVFVGIPYGTGWVLTAHQLRTGTEIHDRQSSRIVVPHAIGAGFVGMLLVLLSIGRFLPLGALSATPWVGESFVFDITHLGIGLLGLIVAVSGQPKKARIYAQVVGIGALCLASVTLFEAFVYIPGFRLLTADLALDLPDLILYASIGIVLTTLGFAVNVDES